MATKKQRRRRAKEQRHDYIWVDDEGNEVEPDGTPVEGEKGEKKSRGASPGPARELCAAEAESLAQTFVETMRWGFAVDWAARASAKARATIRRGTGCSFGRGSAYSRFDRKSPDEDCHGVRNDQRAEGWGGRLGDAQPAGAQSTTWDVELLRVLVSRKGTQVDAQWAIHPQLKQDLLPQEWQEVSDLMAKATNIVGSRFAQILSEAEPDKPGNA